MCLGNKLHNRQSQSAAAGCPRKLPIDLIEPLENPPLVPLCDADAVVAHADFHDVSRYLLGAQFDFFLFARVFPGVIQQIHQQRHQRIGVALHHQLRRHGNFYNCRAFPSASSAASNSTCTRSGRNSNAALLRSIRENVKKLSIIRLSRTFSRAINCK